MSTYNFEKIARRDFLRSLGLGAAALAVPGCLNGAVQKQGHSSSKLPNVVIIFTDDQGYQDVGCFGSPLIKTPNLDRMACEGVKFTDMHVAQAVCGASRAALMTGCYPNRIGLLGAPGPNCQHGIHEDEMTIAELVKQKDYATAIFGKWHLGDNPRFLPLQHGFDEYFGLPYSNDMWPNHPTHGHKFPPLPLIEGNKTIAHNPDQAQLTTWYTERAVKFIDKNKEQPFFLYLAHTMPHVPLFVSDKFKGKSKRGLYGDVIMEIDWSVGQVLEALKRNGLDENTLVIFASDNGPWLCYGDHGGCALPLREGKLTIWEGGQRVPCIMRWPGRIPSGTVCQEPVMTIDWLPTIARLTNTKLPKHKIDGKDIWPLMAGKTGEKSPHEALYLYYRDSLHAVRSGKWKLHFPHSYRTLAGRRGGTGGQPVKSDRVRTGWALYDLERDIGELYDVAKEYPDIVERLKKLGNKSIEEIKRNRREPGRLGKKTRSRN